jgi:hypothetical protein
MGCQSGSVRAFMRARDQVVFLFGLAPQTYGVSRPQQTGRPLPVAFFTAVRKPGPSERTLAWEFFQMFLKRRKPLKPADDHTRVAAGAQHWHQHRQHRHTGTFDGALPMSRCHSTGHQVPNTGIAPSAPSHWHSTVTLAQHRQHRHSWHSTVSTISPGAALSAPSHLAQHRHHRQHSRTHRLPRLWKPCTLTTQGP